MAFANRPTPRLGIFMGNSHGQWLLPIEGPERKALTVQKFYVRESLE